MKVFVSWSGGKDSVLACYRMMQQPVTEIVGLVNMMTENGEYSRSHGLSTAVLREQAAAVGIPLIQRSASWADYEKQFKTALVELKEKGAEAGVFGDIDLEAHREWVERVCRETGLQAILPLWNEKREALLEELICAGFKSRIVVTDQACMGEEWLGCEIDRDFLRKMAAHPHIDPCGEKGEYHTFVYDGPIFKRPVRFYEESRFEKDKHWISKLALGSPA
jgi:uncharacterized protein (TIGR00290 family)